MGELNLEKVKDVLWEVQRERQRQHAKWGEQNLPDGTGGPLTALFADAYRRACQAAAKDGRCTFHHILREEVFEAAAETDAAKLRAELVQVAAVAVQWIEALDRRARAAALAAPPLDNPEEREVIPTWARQFRIRGGTDD